MGRDDIARSPRIGLFSLTSPASAFLSNCCFLVRLAGTHKESFRLITQHTDAVVFLGAQSRKHDSVLKRGYITLWPKLPAFLKSKLKQPTNAVPIRVKALGALRRMRPGFTKLEPGMTILIEALNDPSEEVRSIAEGALGDIGPEAAAAVHALIRSVERGGFSINGIWALGRIGPEAKPAGPLLKAIVRRKTGRQLVYAAEGCGSSSGPEHA